jgi:thymidylate kinase
LSEMNLSYANKSNAGAAHTKACVARALIGALSSDCKAYCILSGYERLPDAFDTDIDFMVGEQDYKRLPQIIENVARQTNTRLFQVVDHEIAGRAYFLASLAGPELTIVQPDSASDYLHFGSLWLRADEVLAARQWHPRGFWIPSSAHEFAYSLIKRLNKREFKPQHGRKLHRLFQEDPLGCDRVIGRFFGVARRNKLHRMAACDGWAELSANLDSFRAELMRHPAESLVQRAASLPRHALHLFDRIVRPTGAWVALMGPDGSGKSLAIEGLRKQLAPAFRGVDCYHLRPKILRGNSPAGGQVTDPHGQPPRGVAASVAKVFFMAADYLFGYALRIAPALRRTRLIFFDRYFYDLLVDSKRVRYGGPQWLLRLAARVVPRPDLVIVLDAPAEVLWSRKQEVPFAEIVRQRAAYLDLARRQPFTVVVNAAQPGDAVIRDCAAAIAAYLARRTAQRLGLQAPIVPENADESERARCQC